MWFCSAWFCNCNLKFSFFFFAFTQTVSALLFELSRRYDTFTSQSIFWFILVVCGIPQLRTQIESHLKRSAFSEVDKYAEYDFTSYIVFYGLSFAIWFLNCFDDKMPFRTIFPKSNVSAATLHSTFRVFFRFLHCFHRDRVPKNRRVFFLDYFSLGSIRSFGKVTKRRCRIKIFSILTPKKHAKKLCRFLLTIGFVQ